MSPLKSTSEIAKDIDNAGGYHIMTEITINMDDSITFSEEERREIAKLISEGKDEEAEALIAQILERLLERFKNQAILGS